MRTLASPRVLVVGGGFAGMSAAVELRKLGAEVHLCEIDPGWRDYGAGISLGGATLRAFRRLRRHCADRGRARGIRRALLLAPAVRRRASFPQGDLRMKTPRQETR